MKPRREPLAARVRKIRGGAPGPWWDLTGCPAGGWSETSQAIARIRDALPLSVARAYSIWQLIDALYRVDHAGRYQPCLSRDEVRP